MKKVLFADDEQLHRDIFEQFMRPYADRIQVLSAGTYGEAHELVVQNRQDLKLAVLDGVFDGDPAVGIQLLEVVQTWCGDDTPIIAISSDEELRNEMLGCGVVYEGDKLNFPDIVNQVLRIVGEA